MVIEEYLRGLVSYDLPDNTLKSILFKRDVNPGEEVDNVSEKDRDLCLAEVYLWCATTPSAKNNTEDADGNWKHIEAGWTTSAFDKRQLRAMAKELFDKWGETATTIQKITLINL